MNKKVKFSLLIFLILILIFLISIFIYANVTKKEKEISNDLVENNNNKDDDKPVLENSIDGVDITDFNIFYDNNKAKHIINFKITNVSLDKLLPFYILLSLKDNKENLIDEVIIKILTLEVNQVRYISYETDADISNVTNYSFEVIEVGGVGN